MKSDFWCSAIALAVALLCVSVDAAVSQQLPAVSGLNGKIEFDAGALSLPAPGFMARAAGTLTVPVGERFGLQADVSLSSAPGFIVSGAVHAFMRDPASYLIGGTLGFVRSPGAMIVAAGPEAELYLDRWTLEAWGGLAVATPTAPAGPARTRPFAMVGLGYYITDNWRFSLGASSLDGYTAVQVGSEYLFDNFDLPVALTSELRVGQDGAVRGMIGLRGYLGANPSKSLIARHREDDPSDRSTALYSAAGGTTLGDGRATASTTPTEPESEQQAPSTEEDSHCLAYDNGVCITYDY